MLKLSGSDYLSVVAEVSALLKRHDPLGLGAPDGDLPADEYAAEAADIVRSVIQADAGTSDEVADLVYGVFRESFGIDDAGTLSTYEPLAPEVIGIMQRYRE